jgi:ferritin-like metal-binding protein YciE
MLDTLRKLLEEQVKDLYSAEKQLVQALPRMAKGAASEELREAFTSHLEETRGHVKRLEQIARLIETKPTGKHCKGMEGLIEEGKELLEEDGTEAVIDSGLIAAAQRVEHYEMAGYGSARAAAEALGLEEVVDLLQETLDEEGAADKKLTSISEAGLLADAASGAEQEDGQEEPTNGKRRQPAKRRTR